MPLFLMGCFPVDFQEGKRPLRTKSVKRPIKVGKRPINEGKRPIKAKVLVGVSIGCLMGCFRAPPPWRKTAPLKRPIKRSMNNVFLRPLGSWTSAPSGHGRPRKKTLFSCAPSDGGKAFGSGRPPGYPPGRPRDIPPKNFYSESSNSVSECTPLAEG